MGWASGSEIARELIDVIKRNVEDKNARRKIYDKMIDTFEKEDCDTLDECRGIDEIFDGLMDERKPSEDEIE